MKIDTDDSDFVRNLCVPDGRIAEAAGALPSDLRDGAWDHPPQWRHLPPSVPGFYWLRLETEEFVLDFPVSVEQDGRVLTIGVESTAHVSAYTTAQWFGPILPPS